jgi:uncharacterized membrane protein
VSLQPADRAWIVLGAGVLLYDVFAVPGQTLSEGADRYMVHHKWVTRSVGIALVAHVCNMVGPRYDLVHWLFVLSRKWRRP